MPDYIKSGFQTTIWIPDIWINTGQVKVCYSYVSAIQLFVFQKTQCTMFHRKQCKNAWKYHVWFQDLLCMYFEKRMMYAGPICLLECRTDQILYFSILRSPQYQGWLLKWNVTPHNRRGRNVSFLATLFCSLLEINALFVLLPWIDG